MRLNTEENPLPGVLNHIDLFHRLNARDCNPSEAGGPAEGNKVAGGRAYFLRGVGCFLNQALINYALQFLEKKQFTAMHCPFFIRQSMMGLAAQLEDFDEQLYKVSGDARIDARAVVRDVSCRTMHNVSSLFFAFIPGHWRRRGQVLDCHIRTGALLLSRRCPCGS